MWQVHQMFWKWMHLNEISQLIVVGYSLKFRILISIEGSEELCLCDFSLEVGSHRKSSFYAETAAFTNRNIQNAYVYVWSVVIKSKKCI